MKRNSVTAATPRRPRPDPHAPLEAFVSYVYARSNPHGWHTEWWLHVGGCRRLLKVVRHTVTHEIHAVAAAQETVSVPQDGP